MNSTTPQNVALGLVELLLKGQELSEAHRAHAEAFLRFKLGQPLKGQKITDNVAKAQADIEVDVIMPQAKYDVARLDAERKARQL